MDDNTLRMLQANYQRATGGLQMPAPEQQQQPKGRSGWLKALPIATSIIGGIGGSLLAPGVGTAAGGAGGGALGEWLAQKLSGEDTNAGKIALEGGFGAFGGIGKAVKATRGAVSAGRAGEGASSVMRNLRSGATPAGVADDAVTAVTKSPGKVSGWVSDKLLRGADNTALRAAQLSGKKEALKGFEKRFGEDMGAYIRKNNLIGKTGKDVEDTLIKGLNEKYATTVGGIKQNISSSDVLAQNMKPGSSLDKLLKSASTENKQLADDVFKELDEVFKREGGAISPKRLNEIKSEYQTLARNAYKLGSNTKGSVNEKVAEYLKKTLQGVSGSDELAKTGKELDKAYKASDLLASAAQNGRGTLSLRLTDLLGAGAGGAAGGVPGVVAGVAATKAINSPRTQSFIANKLASTGEAIAGKSAAKAGQEVTETGAKTTAKNMVKAQAPIRAMQFIAGGGEGGELDAEVNPNNPLDPTSAAFNPALAGGTDLASMMGLDEEQPAELYSREALMADIQRDPKNAEKYIGIHEYLNKASENEKPPSSMAQKQMATAQSGLDSLGTLESIISKGGVPKGTVVAGRGLVGGLGGRVLGTSAFDAAADNIADAIIRMRTGAAATKEEMRTFRSQLPQASDSPEVVRQKLATVRSYLQELSSNPSGGTTIEELLAAQ